VSKEAIEAFEGIARTYKSGGFSNFRTWFFEPHEGEDLAILHELRAHGLIETFMLGERRWRLTQHGLDRALAID
jgi:hypothetical protein